MPTSPLPNCSVPVLPPPLPAIVVVLLLSLPQAARKAASAVEPPVTASSLRRDTGSLVTRSSALGLLATAMLPPRSRVGHQPHLRGVCAAGSAGAGDGRGIRGGGAAAQAGEPARMRSSARAMRLTPSPIRSGGTL